MAQFQSRPETPDEWGGLPAEPRDAASAAEELSVAEAVDASSFGLGAGSAVESVIVTLPVPVEPAD